MLTNMTQAHKNVSGLRKLIGRKIFGHWELPNVNQLPDISHEEDEKILRYQPPIDPQDLEDVLQRYGIIGEFKDYHIGASVTTYEIEVPVGTRFKSLLRWRDDIARDLGTPSLRIIKCIKDSSLIGFEVESSERYTVHFKNLFKELHSKLTLPVIMGEDTYGNPVYEDLTKMPHMLVAGQTGSGKSVFLNTTITTLLCTKKPHECQFLIVDPKQIEFVAYEGIPHLMKPIASNPEEARRLLDIAVNEMEHRFQLLRQKKVKKLSDYNKKTDRPLPYIVFVVDEFADLMLMGTKKEAKEVENKIVRIAQKARAVGIHMILATQKPLVSIVTSLIKANMPARISFEVASSIDSRVILDEIGAETLTGMGDMLYKNPNARSEYAKISRIQAPWLSDDELDTLLR